MALHLALQVIALRTVLEDVGRDEEENICALIKETRVRGHGLSSLEHTYIDVTELPYVG